LELKRGLFNETRFRDRHSILSILRILESVACLLLNKHSRANSRRENFSEIFLSFLVGFSLIFCSIFAMTDNLDLFPADKWVKRTEVDHREATEQFKAAVASARSTGDEAIKQVRFLCLYFLILCYFSTFI